MAEAVPNAEEEIAPKINGFKLRSTLTGSFSAISERLSQLQLFTIEQNDDGIIAFKVESRDMQKKPFLFIIIELHKDSVDVRYSLVKDTSDKLRKLYVLRNLLGLLSLISDLYSVDEQTVFQYIDTSIDDVLNSLSQNYSLLYNNYDSLLEEYKQLKKMSIDLTNSNKNLTAEAAKLKSDNQELSTKLKELQTYSDESLMAMLEEWIEAHDNTIDIIEFSKANKVDPPRIEQILNKMVSAGYLQIKG